MAIRTWFVAASCVVAAACGGDDSKGGTPPDGGDGTGGSATNGGRSSTGGRAGTGGRASGGTAGAATGGNAGSANGGTNSGGSHTDGGVDSGSKTIGPAGGTVSDPSGASAAVPAGALSTSVAIEVETVTSGYPALPAGWELLGPVVAFTPHGQTFSSPVTVTVPFTEAPGAMLATAAPGGAWDTVVDATRDGETFTAATSHFSFYAGVRYAQDASTDAGPVARGGFRATGNMLTARKDHTATALLDGRVLVVGGYDGTLLKSAETFDPAATGGLGAFAATGELTTGRTWHTATRLLDGRVLVTGGAGGTATALTYLRSAEIFDPAANGGAGAFTPTGNMVEMRYYHLATRLPDGKVLITGGQKGPGAANILNSAELFDPETGTFSLLTGGAGAREAEDAKLLLPQGPHCDVAHGRRGARRGGHRSGARARRRDLRPSPRRRRRSLRLGGQPREPARAPRDRAACRGPRPRHGREHQRQRTVDRAVRGLPAVGYRLSVPRPCRRRAAGPAGRTAERRPRGGSAGPGL
jgi:hypothetical protein